VIHPWNQTRYTRLMADLGRLPHALLLHGPAGIGKLDLALAIAQGLLCESPGPDQQACGVCDACNWFQQGNHPDFRLLQPPTDDEEDPPTEAADAPTAKGGKGPKRQAIIRVDRIREVTHFTQLTPHRGGWRIVVIEPVEAMNAEAANALLKTLEVPPPRVLLLLVSHRLGRLLPTVISRCHKLHVSLPDPADALTWLEAEGVSPAKELLAEAGGAPLAAQVLADPERVAQRERFLDELGRHGQLDACALAQEFKGSHALVWGWLIRWVLDTLTQRLAGQSRYFVARSAQTATLAKRIDLAGLLHFQRELIAAGRSLRHPLHSQLLIESWLVRYVELAGDRP